MEGEDKVGARTAFKQLLNQHIAIGTVWQSVFEIESKKRTLSAAEYLLRLILNQEIPRYGIEEMT